MAGTVLVLTALGRRPSEHLDSAAGATLENLETSAGWGGFGRQVLRTRV